MSNPLPPQLPPPEPLSAAESVVQFPNTAIGDPLLGGDWLDRSP
jgi:hypothetical protein